MNKTRKFALIGLLLALLHLLAGNDLVAIAIAVPVIVYLNVLFIK